MLLLGAGGGARQESVVGEPARQASAAPEPIRSPEIDALAEKLAEKIARDKAKTVVIVGGAVSEIKVNKAAGKETVLKVSELGVSLRDGLNDALSRKAKNAQVMGTPELRALLKQNRVSGGMICDGGLADWIAALAHADAMVTIELEKVENGRAVILAELFDQRRPKVYDKSAQRAVPFAEFESEIKLTQMQADSASREYAPPVRLVAAKFETNQPNMPKCAYCPNPDYSQEARQLRIMQAPVYFKITVRPDRMADDIIVVRSAGHGLHGKAIESILKWKFTPGVDSDGHPGATQVPVEVLFQLY